MFCTNPECYGNHSEGWMCAFMEKPARLWEENFTTKEIRPNKLAIEAERDLSRSTDE